MGQEALAAANQDPESEQPLVDRCPEPPVIPIDFYNSGGEGRIFERLEPGKVGRALLNGREVWVQRFTLNGKNEVSILRDGDPYHGGHWQTWEVMRESLNERERRVATPALDAGNIGAIARRLRREFDAAATRRARMRIGRERRDEGSEETRGNALGIYLRDHMDGSPRTTIDIEQKGISIRIKGGNLNVAPLDFFGTLEKYLNRLGKVQKLTPAYRKDQATTAFSGQWEGVAFNTIRTLAVTLDPFKVLRPRPNVKGTLEIRSEYSTVSGFNFFVFEYKF